MSLLNKQNRSDSALLLSTELLWNTNYRSFPTYIKPAKVVFCTLCKRPTLKSSSLRGNSQGQTPFKYFKKSHISANHKNKLIQILLKFQIFWAVYWWQFFFWIQLYCLIQVALLLKPNKQCAYCCEIGSVTGSASAPSVQLYFLMIFSRSRLFCRWE